MPIEEPLEGQLGVGIVALLRAPGVAMTSYDLRGVAMEKL